MVIYAKSSLKPSLMPLPPNARLSDNVDAVFQKLNVNGENLLVLSICRSPRSTAAEDQSLIKSIKSITRCQDGCLIHGDFNAPAIDSQSNVSLTNDSVDNLLLDGAEESFVH